MFFLKNYYQLTCNTFIIVIIIIKQMYPSSNKGIIKNNIKLIQENKLVTSWNPGPSCLGKQCQNDTTIILTMFHPWQYLLF